MDGSSHMIWNAILSLACGSFIWWIRGINVKIEENRKLMSRTREEMARDYALKDEVDKDLDKIIKFMKTDKKNNSDKIKLVLLKKMGQTILNQEYSVKNLNGFLKNELID